MEIKDKINYLNRRIKSNQNSIYNIEKKLKILNKIYEKYPTCNIRSSSKEIELNCIDKCNKIKIYNQYGSVYFKFYFLDEEIKVFNINKYIFLNIRYDSYGSDNQTITIQDYISCFPESFPKRKYWIKKIEKHIVNYILKRNHLKLSDKSFNYDKIQGYMIFT